MAINGMGGAYGVNYASQVSEIAKAKPQEEVKKTEAFKTEEKTETPVQERVEVRAKQDVEKVAKVEDQNKADQIKTDVMKMMKEAPNQAVLAQAGNMTPQRIANLL